MEGQQGKWGPLEETKTPNMERDMETAQTVTRGGQPSDSGFHTKMLKGHMSSTAQSGK